MALAEQMLSFYENLKINERLPKSVGVLNPYQVKDSMALCAAFYKKYYSDSSPRQLILGINPGRFGGGITGIPFTDPVKLEEKCGIENEMPKRTELSADFIYAMMDAYGGLKKFYGDFLFSSISPLGFIKDGKNLNYYDTPGLQKALEPFIRRCIYQLIELGVLRENVFCLGEGQNYKYLTALNNKEKLFDKIIPLAHPRFIMQYKRKQVGEYIDKYVSILKS